ncbi:aminoglycoside phosphotransferase family protein [Microbacterium sp. M28]|uniref:aminoglycoside phosphotransferase family protein n=1 Tax=Microbacterium sp. M28 TaxID=2962064 RepID=UPI0021F4D8A5|nr:aminoglycoside phosphotransferase family protein [Microbacterium sp. M28]UYO98313.1 aminoglycoside phosphotransferase family protein [Microbacterium sp. M28]
MSDRPGRLTPAQWQWVSERMPDARVVRDMSWGVVESTVLHLRTTDGDVVLKAGGASNHHFAREWAAHPAYTHDLVATGHAALLRDSDLSLRVMVLDYLPGDLVEGTDAEHESSTYRQAGALLRRLHDLESRMDADVQSATAARALRWLDGPHRIDETDERAARVALAAAPTGPVRVVPTHGDWQPRNWLLDDGTVRIIDFGRFGFRPPSSDLARLDAQQWRGRPDLEQAFFEGYGEDPRDPDLWRWDRLKEAVGTACWAFQVGEEDFEAQGHRMLAEALDAF